MLKAVSDLDVLEQAFNWFVAFESGKDDIVTGWRPFVFSAAVRFSETSPGDPAADFVFNALKRLFEATTNSNGKIEYLCAMGQTQNITRHKEVLDYILLSGKVRYTNIEEPLGKLSSTTHEGARSCWDYFVKNYSKLYAKYSEGPVWAALVEESCCGLQTLEEADAVAAFFELNPPGSAKQRLTQAIERIRLGAHRLERDRVAVAAYFGKFSDYAEGSNA